MANNKLIIGISGIRGTINLLNDEVICKIAKATIKTLKAGKNKTFILARDSRMSGERFVNVLAGAIRDCGMNVKSLGILPTPAALWAVKKLAALGGIIVTASHNPSEYNGFKLVNSKGLFFDTDEGETFLKYYNKLKNCKTPLYTLNPVDDLNDIHKNYIGCISKLSDRNLLFEEMVVADVNRGAGAVLTPRLLDTLGVKYVLMGGKPDGNFEHIPEPLPENLASLGQRVKKEHAAIGFAQDPDADRLAIVDENGTPIGEDWTLGLCLLNYLDKNPGPVVVNLSTSRIIDDIAAKFNCPVFRTKIGELHVSKKMMEIGATIGGEGNGGVILPLQHYCRDSFVAITLVLDYLAHQKKKVSEIISCWTKYYMVKEKIMVDRNNLATWFENIKSRFDGRGVVSTLDGLKISWDDSWIHIRPSNTEPVVRIIAEAPSLIGAKKLCRNVSDTLNM